MTPFDSLPTPAVDRQAPVTRGLWCWPALLPAAALAIDAAWPLPEIRPGVWVTALDVAALACLAWAALGRGRAHGRAWGTPVDGRIFAGLALAVLHAVRTAGAPEPMLWLRQIAASGLCFYALAARLRRETRAPDAIWPAFALIVLALAGFVLAFATQGVAALAEATRVVDARWASQHGLVKALLVGTVLCAGRASEPGSRALWRVTALVGGVASIVCAFAGGAGLDMSSLGSLDEPFYFATTIVAFTFLAGLTRMAWALSRERAAEAGRWRSAAAAFPLIAVLLVFGGTTGGEGLRALAALAGAAVIATRAAPAPGTRREPAAAAGLERGAEGGTVPPVNRRAA
jgi:hypothetical protein